MGGLVDAWRRCKKPDQALSIGLSLLCGLLTAAGFGMADFAAKLSTNKVGFLRTALFMQVIGSFFVLGDIIDEAVCRIQRPDQSPLQVNLFDVGFPEEFVSVKH